MQVKDVMSSECHWIAPETTLVETAQLMKDKDIGFLAIGENDRLIGTVTDRDITVRAVADNLVISKYQTARRVKQLDLCW